MPAKTTPFVTKLFKIVNGGDKDTVSWHKDGASFVIKDVEKFSKTCLASNFKSSLFSSFVRQLHFCECARVATSRPPPPPPPRGNPLPPPPLPYFLAVAVVCFDVPASFGLCTCVQLCRHGMPFFVSPSFLSFL